MSKLIRFDQDHFGYLVDRDISVDMAKDISSRFSNEWPGKSLMIFEADEFVDLTGQYEVGQHEESEEDPDGQSLSANFAEGTS